MMSAIGGKAHANNQKWSRQLMTQSGHPNKIARRQLMTQSGQAN
jgi:hypothetical protein